MTKGQIPLGELVGQPAWVRELVRTCVCEQLHELVGQTPNYMNFLPNFALPTSSWELQLDD